MSPGRRAAAATVVLLLPLLGGCADTVSPILGGLHLGVRSGAFRVPVMQNAQPPFDYPNQAWNARIGGQTRLRIHIATDGTVDSAYVLESSGYPVLDSAALAGARRLRYRPARQGDRPVAVWAVLPVRYPLPEEVHEP
jgi:protein TonB